MESINVFILIVQSITLLALVGTLWVYFRQLKIMEMASIRTQHMEIVKLALLDPELLQVWHENHSDDSVEDFKAHLFVGLDMGNTEARLLNKVATRRAIEATLNHCSSNHYYRRFWSSARHVHQDSMDPRNADKLWFFSLCDRLFSTVAEPIPASQSLAKNATPENSIGPKSRRAKTDKNLSQ